MKIYNTIFNVIFYLFIAMMAVVLILFAFGIKPFVTLSGSMEPAIHTGSLCFVNTKADYTDIEQGDVIAFETSNGDQVTHRVISITDEGMETQGDANDVSDGISTTEQNFFGKTLFSVPYAGYAVVALQQPRNIAILACVVAFIIAMSFLLKVKTDG